MVWDKDDYLATALILSIIIIGSGIALYLLGVIPRVDEYFEFLKN